MTPVRQISPVLFMAICLLLMGMLGLFYLSGIGGRTTTVVRHEAPSGLTANVSGDKFEEEDISSVSVLTGVSCPNAARRPFAVILAEDRESRPLSGIGLADLVVEMPVVTGSITRMLAVYACEDPQELGSIRSARHDFIPLVEGYDAIFVHWGGSDLALAELEKGAVDNLDAMPNYFETFWRKKGLAAPHNGFTSMARMVYAAEKLGYRMTTEFEGYQFSKNQKSNTTSQRYNAKISVGYKYPYNVEYEYIAETNSYVRWRGGAKEIDRLTNKQVEAKNVVVMRAKSRQIGGGYNDVDILGSGKAVVYRNGEGVGGVWRKEKSGDVLRFYNERGEEIEFMQGKIWIEVVEPSIVVNYQEITLPDG